MGARAGRAVLRAGMAILAFLWAASLSSASTRSITTPDGTVVSVWEARARGLAADPDASGGSFLACSISDSSGTWLGTVAPTVDPAIDRHPALAVDPSSGAVVLVWSRFDGVYFKIAYARLEQREWIDFHYITFGPGNDAQPRIGTSATGSYLFWITQGGQYVYAPVEPSGGRLLAAPQGLALGFLRNRGLRSISGNTDAPNVPGKKKNSSVWGAADLTTEGNTDGPNVPGKKKNSSVWAVGSSDACGRLTLVLPDAAADIAHIVAFRNGVKMEIGFVPLPEVVPDGFGDDLAASRLGAGCQ